MLRAIMRICDWMVISREGYIVGIYMILYARCLHARVPRGTLYHLSNFLVSRGQSNASKTAPTSKMP